MFTFRGTKQLQGLTQCCPPAQCLPHIEPSDRGHTVDQLLDSLIWHFHRNCMKERKSSHSPKKGKKQNTLKYFEFTNVLVHVGVLTFMGGHIVMMYLS